MAASLSTFLGQVDLLLPLVHNTYMDKHQQSIIEEIARTHLGIYILETRRSDYHDFYALPVWSLKSALEAAYAAGRLHETQLPKKD